MRPPLPRHDERPQEPLRPPEAELLYDDRCRACRFAAGSVRKWDLRGRIKLTGFSALESRGHDLTREGLGSSVHVVREGVLLSGGDAVLAVLSTLFQPLSVLERFQTVRRVIRRGYRVLANILHG